MIKSISRPLWLSVVFCFCMQLTNIAGIAASPQVVATEPLHIVLVGDSTVTDDAGWGKGFRSCLKNSVTCTNMAKSGRSSRSFRTEGWWKKSLALKPDFLLIQFGHNDQPGKGLSRESVAETDFRNHLRNYVDGARTIGCQPILVTPLTRRRWTPQHTIEPTLAAYAEATKVVAKELKVALLDLNRLSIQHCNAIGPECYRAYEPMTGKGADHTHLNAEGSQVIGAMVAKELGLVVEQLSFVIQLPVYDGTNQAEQKSLQTKDGRLQLEQTDAAVTIKQAGNLVLNYNKQAPQLPEGIDPIYTRSGFLHPVATPKAKAVTALYPWDHPHQNGIFSAWVKTTWGKREVDFWNMAKGSGLVLHQRVVSTFTNDGAVGFEVDLVHRSTEAPAVDILRERWKVTVYQTDGSYHCFDIQSQQFALTDIPLTVQKYHYGGMAMRGLTRWLKDEPKKDGAATSEVREASSFVNDQGSDRKQGNHQNSRWVTLTGTVDGEPVSITVMSHSDNFRSPQPARLHPTKPYFCFSPCVEDEFKIDRNAPLVSQYRYLLTDSKPDQEWLRQQFERWSEQSE